MNNLSSTSDNKPKGLFKLLHGAYQGGLAIWLSLANILILAATGLFLWCGYQFFTVETSNELIFWGLCTVTAILVQIALKQWVWLEIARSSIVQEIQELKARLPERG